MKWKVILLIVVVFAITPLNIAHSIGTDKESLPIPEETKGTVGCFYEITTHNGFEFFPTIKGVREGSPCHKQGLRKGDQITKYNGNSTLNISLEEFSNQLKKLPGDSIELEVKRGAKLKKIILVSVDFDDLLVNRDQMLKKK